VRGATRRAPNPSAHGRLCAGWALVIAALSSVATPGLSSAAPPEGAATGSVLRSLLVGGERRTYHVHRPATLARAAPVPLVLVLHGGFGDGLGAERSYGWDALADAEAFVVAYPDGLGRAWNAGAFCCGLPGRRGTDDVGFLARLIARLAADENIDPRRLYAAGMSNGAMMAYRLACESPVRLAAIGPVAGTMLVPCAGARPVAVLAIHGTGDRHVPFEGGRPAVGVNRDRVHPAVPAVIRSWRAIDRCETPRREESGALSREWATCVAGREVALIAIADAGHQWPGGRAPAFIPARLLHLDPPSTALDATRTLWRFFAAHPLPEE
jgi:polyhydroxybutyrate depolymerase